LQHLDIQSDILLSDISIAWHNLTTFETNCISVDEFFEVLRLVEGLNSFRLRDLSGVIEDYPLPITPLTHSALTGFYLEAGGTASELEVSEFETLFDLVVFPSLEKFGFGCSRRIFFPNRAIPSLLNRSHCPLTHFDLFGDLVDGSADDLISIFSDLPTITHLKLEDSYSFGQEDGIMSNRLLQRLTPTTSTLQSEGIHTGRVLPRLESLEFLGYKAFSWSCLASLVSSTTSGGGPNTAAISERQRSAASIRRISFRVYFRGEREFIDAHSVAQFKGARDAGVSIAIVNEGPSMSLSPSFDAADTSAYPFDLLP
jgi:hypothetical protein